MADSNAPRMPLAASSNMTAGMSTILVTSQEINDVPTSSPAPNSDATGAAGEQSGLARSEGTQHIAMTTLTRVSTSSQHVAGVRHDKTSSREKALSMQRIQLAKQLSDERKLCKDLEARLASLQHELASLTSSNKAFEAECAKLREQIDATVQQLESRTIEAKRRDEATEEIISCLESKLEVASESLAESEDRREIANEACNQALETCAQQVNKFTGLENELKISQLETHALQVMHDELKELYERDVRVTIHNMEQSHKSRESDSQQRLTLKDAEIKKLKRQTSMLKDSRADDIAKKEAAEKARDRALAETQKLQQSLDELERSVKPFTQTVVICVDVSGSLTTFLPDIKQAYRDILLMIKSNNSDVKVAVVVHGCNEQHSPSPPQVISGKTFGIVDSIGGTGGTEDYAYCLKQTVDLFKKNDDSKKLVILVGDGNAECSSIDSLSSACEQLKSAQIMVYSIIIPENRRFDPIWGWSMERISKVTGGRVEYQDTYLSSLDKHLRHEREQHFKAANM
ncbi:hypothetical protein GGS26DRAFT_589695 [Hypomontagnella submonticulosa]|nr:hypothetical protein GGS26DRAFT_589695 [Hypomontagnella submonticulosa]